MLRHIDDCVARKESFAFETTLSGKGYVKKIEAWQLNHYEVIICYLKLPAIEMAIERVEARVSQGGHHVPENVIKRRFVKSWDNFQQKYKFLADRWIIFDTSMEIPSIIDKSE